MVPAGAEAAGQAGRCRVLNQRSLCRCRDLYRGPWLHSSPLRTTSLVQSFSNEFLIQHANCGPKSDQTIHEHDQPGSKGPG